MFRYPPNFGNRLSYEGARKVNFDVLCVLELEASTDRINCPDLSESVTAKRTILRREHKVEITHLTRISNICAPNSVEFR